MFQLNSQTPEDFGNFSLNEARYFICSFLKQTISIVEEDCQELRKIEIECFKMLNQVCSTQTEDSKIYYAIDVMSNYYVKDEDRPFDLIINKMETGEQTWTVKQVKEFLTCYLEQIVEILSDLLPKDNESESSELTFLSNLEIPALVFLRNVAENGEALNLLIEKMKNRLMLQQSIVDSMGNEDSDRSLLNKVIGKIHG